MAFQQRATVPGEGINELYKAKNNFMLEQQSQWLFEISQMFSDLFETDGIPKTQQDLNTKQFEFYHTQVYFKEFVNLFSIQTKKNQNFFPSSNNGPLYKKSSLINK